MPNRPSSPRDPLRRGGAAGLVDLWTTQRSVAHNLHNANSSSKRKRTNDVLSNRTSPSAIDTLHEKTAACTRAEMTKFTSRILDGLVACGGFTERWMRFCWCRIGQRTQTLSRQVLGGRAAHQMDCVEVGIATRQMRRHLKYHCLLTFSQPG